MCKIASKQIEQLRNNCQKRKPWPPSFDARFSIKHDLLWRGVSRHRRTKFRPVFKYINFFSDIFFSWFIFHYRTDITDDVSVSVYLSLSVNEKVCALILYHLFTFTSYKSPQQLIFYSFKICIYVQRCCLQQKIKQTLLENKSENLWNINTQKIKYFVVKFLK